MFIWFLKSKSLSCFFLEVLVINLSISLTALKNSSLVIIYTRNELASLAHSFYTWLKQLIHLTIVLLRSIYLGFKNFIVISCVVIYSTRYFIRRFLNIACSPSPGRHRAAARRLLFYLILSSRLSKRLTLVCG